MTVRAGSPKRQKVRVAASIGLSLLLLLAVVWVAATRWNEIRESVEVIGKGRLAAGALFLTLGVVATGECWRRWMSALHNSFAPLTAHRLFYLTQTAKYVPGSIWPFVVQAAISRRFGVSRAAIVAATGLFLMSHTVTATVVGGAWLTVSLPGWLVTLLLPAVSLIALLVTPPGLRFSAGILRRFTSRSGAPPDLKWSTTAATTAAMIGAWALYGLATFILAQPFGLGARGFLIMAGAYAIGWLAGFLAVPAPGGLGVREAAFVAVTTPLVGTGPALTIALTTRLFQTLADLGLGAISASVLRSNDPVVEGRPHDSS